MNVANALVETLSGAKDLHQWASEGWRTGHKSDRQGSSTSSTNFGRLCLFEAKCDTKMSEECYTCWFHSQVFHPVIWQFISLLLSCWTERTKHIVLYKVLLNRYSIILNHDNTVVAPKTEMIAHRNLLDIQSLASMNS